MEEVKVALLEQKLEDLKPVIIKLDAAIEKLSEVNTTVSRMLAVHEERISKQEEIDSILFAKIDKLRDKMDLDHDNVLQRIRRLEQRVWISIGAVAMLSFVANNSSWVTKILTTQAEPTTMEWSKSS